MAVDFLQFLLNFILAGFVIRYAQVKLIARDSAFGNALAFIH